MDIILNSIMLFSLLSTPLEKFDYREYKLHTNNIKIHKNQTKKTKVEDINSIMIEIDNNFNVINSLLTEKKKISNSISIKFNQIIKNKQNLTEEQMSCFKEYNDIIIKEEKNISLYNTKIHNKKDMINLENELLSSKNNLKNIQDKLLVILNNQIKVIVSLYRVIFNLRLSLELI
ncbi:hypothetical protein [uncultured Tyzzerella sp.]|uniref:hypothetical protein n=1 Tax=uncultured Tyzzerella sp. TaxID=2321398 RepID=UPI0029439352|nr:hypothetical protein [uncultured Tyzzerella sp.]